MVSLKHLSRTAALKSLSSVYHHVNLRRRIKYGVKYSPCRAMRAACHDYKSVLLFRAQLFSFYSDYLGNKNNLLILPTE